MSVSQFSNNRFAFTDKTKFALYVEDEFIKDHSKTALGVLRFAPNQVVAVIDSTNANCSIEDLTKIKHNCPIVSSIAEALPYNPQALVLGIALSGGKLPKSWRKDIITACQSGLDIINGLHDFLCEDPEIMEVAKKSGVNLIDLRKPPSILSVATGRARALESTTILTIGTDCSSGKMTTAFELHKFASQAGYNSKFIATGQTGILIAGGIGIGIDRIIGDFMAGAIEELVISSSVNQDFLFIEGQGSILHPGFSAVTLALMHGSCPDAFILCHNAGQTHIDYGQVLIPDLISVISLYENLMLHLKSAKIIGIALNTKNLSNEDALKAIEETKQALNLPVTDTVRFGVSKLFNAIVSYAYTQGKIKSWTI